MNTIETERLALRHLRGDDAAFLVRQLNERSWLQYIGDRGVRTIADAEDYIATRLGEQYKSPGIGMHLMQLKPSLEPIGVCGLVRRESLPAPDLGFALLESHWGKGYAREAATALLTHVKQSFSIVRVLAITTLDNARSAKLLLGLGFRSEGLVRLALDAEELRLFVLDSQQEAQGPSMAGPTQ